MSAPLPVSVIIPALNEEHCLGACLASLRPLLAAGCEVIVVDGGSADGTCRVAEAHAVRLITAARGRASQMNAGARQAGGALLLFLHADSRLSAHACRQLLAVSRDGGWGRCDLYFDQPGAQYRFLAWMIRRRSRLTGIVTGDQGFFVSRTLFRQVGGFPRLPLMEDVAISRALRRLRRPACLDGRIYTSARRWQQHGYIKTILLMWRLRLGYFLGENVHRLAQRYR